MKKIKFFKEDSKTQRKKLAQQRAQYLIRLKMIYKSYFQKMNLTYNSKIYL